MREALRREVNFGCPVVDCGVPFLTYHHFDPAWVKEHHHRPEGLIALCSNHAARADGELWTPEQLRDLKGHPFLQDRDLEDSFGYLRKEFICRAGIASGRCQTVVSVAGEPILRFQKDSAGFYRLNATIRDATGAPLLRMIGSDWTVYSNRAFDVDCGARGKRLRVRSKDRSCDFKLVFDELTPHELNRRLAADGGSADQFDHIWRSIGMPATIPIWTLGGRLTYRAQPIMIGSNSLEYRGIHLENVAFVGTQNIGTLVAL